MIYLTMNMNVNFLQVEYGEYSWTLSDSRQSNSFSCPSDSSVIGHEKGPLVSDVSRLMVVLYIRKLLEPVVHVLVLFILN